MRHQPTQSRVVYQLLYFGLRIHLWMNLRRFMHAGCMLFEAKYQSKKVLCRQYVT